MRRTLIIPLVMLLPLSGPSAYAQGDVWAALRHLPPDSRVRVTLSDGGTNVTGRRVELRDDAVVMRENAADRAHAFRLPPGATLRDAVPFARAEVSRASLVEIALPYRPATARDTAIVKRVIREFGDPGRKARLEIRHGAEKVNGTIDDIDTNDFGVRVGRNRVVRVAYGDVVSVRRQPRVSKGDWITIGAVGSGLAALITYCGMGYCEQ